MVVFPAASRPTIRIRISCKRLFVLSARYQNRSSNVWGRRWEQQLKITFLEKSFLKTLWKPPIFADCTERDGKNQLLRWLLWDLQTPPNLRVCLIWFWNEVGTSAAIPQACARLSCSKAALYSQHALYARIIASRAHQLWAHALRHQLPRERAYWRGKLAAIAQQHAQCLCMQCTRPSHCESAFPAARNAIPWINIPTRPRVRRYGKFRHERDRQKGVWFLIQATIKSEWKVGKRKSVLLVVHDGVSLHVFCGLTFQKHALAYGYAKNKSQLHFRLAFSTSTWLLLKSFDWCMFSFLIYESLCKKQRSLRESRKTCFLQIWFGPFWFVCDILWHYSMIPGHPYLLPCGLRFCCWPWAHT